MVLTKNNLSSTKELPNDLRVLIDNIDCCKNLLNQIKCRFIDSDNIPMLLSQDYLNDNDKQDKYIMANISATNKVFEYITFIVETVDGSVAGYWHGPENIDIQLAPIVMYDTEGQFSILNGKSLIEAIVGDYLFDDDEKFLFFQNQFQKCGINISAKWSDLVQKTPTTIPNILHNTLYKENIAHI